MNRISALVLSLFLLFPLGLVAQNLEIGRTLFQNGDYERAARFFDQMESPEANLYSGKSYFSLGQLLKAKHYLNQANIHASSVNVKQEAQYTLALVYFQLDDFYSSLENLYALKQSNSASVFNTKAELLYNQILNYVSISQLYEIFNRSNNDNIRFDLLSASIGRFEYSTAKTVFEKFKNNVVNFNENRLFQIEEDLSDSLIYRQKYTEKKYPSAPSGILYKIGVALPHFEFDSDEYEISQHLYFGIQIAIEEYNASNTDKKVFLKYRDTNINVNSPAEALNKLVWDDDVDVIIGPLFSEVAQKFSKLSEEYEVPVLTPLANSDSLNIDDNFLFQLNPTFAVRGIKMAQYAVNVLKLDTLAVLAEKNSLGEASAYGFLNEAQRLGAVVQHFFVEDLESDGYSILQYTQKFSKSDTLDQSPGLKAIYAPFTGAVSSSLIQSLITDLEASRSDYILLGSEEWRDIELSGRRLPGTSIYYSQSFNTSETTSKEAENFKSAFRLRFQIEANQFAFIGYDAASLILKILDEVENPDYLKEGLRNLNYYKGLSTKVSFSGNHINQNVEVNSITQF